MNWRVWFDEFGDDIDLLENSVDEFGAVAGADEQSFDAGAQEASVDLEVRATAVLLGVDDVDAAGGDGGVVDVRSAVWDPPVMQQSQQSDRV